MSNIIIFMYNITIKLSIMENEINYVEMNKPNILNIQYFGKTKKNKNFYYSRSNSQEFIFEYVLEGKGYIILNDQKYTVTANDFYIIPINQNYEYFSDYENPYERIWFNGNGKFISSQYKIYFNNAPIVISKINLSLFNKIITILNSYNSEQDFIKLVSELSRMFSSAYFNKIKPNKTMVIQSKANIAAIVVKKYLLTHTYEKFNLNKICSELKLSKNYIINIFKDTYNITPQVFHMKLRLDAAELMLINTIKSRSDIAYELGFCDEHHFSKMFKKYKGYPPMKIRKKK